MHFISNIMQVVKPFFRLSFIDSLEWNFRFAVLPKKHSGGSPASVKILFFFSSFRLADQAH